MTDDDHTPTGWGTLPEPPDLSGPVRSNTPSGARRVPPSPNVPPVKRRAAEIEAAHAQSAEGYDAVDAATEMWESIARKAEEGAVTAELEVSDSLVHVFFTRGKP